MRLLAPFVGALAFAAAACSEPAGPGVPDTGSVLFEIEYVNFAWTPTWLGAYVDAEGQVFAFDRGGRPWQGDEHPTAGQLAEKYAAGRRLVRSVGPGEAAGKAALISAASRGTLSERRGACADAGTVRFSAMVYDAAAGRYTRVLLHLHGDVAQTNHAPEARELYLWLRTLPDVPMLPGGACDPFGG
ncbi:MAG TPA: hypothetical protein VEW03_09010 [Longimicrobiaceae bacterium]|nr:hypothetical protein [Longimicrobiaceae bacterium]